jgi:Tripartite tricarboxylate transporter TctB family
VNRADAAVGGLILGLVGLLLWQTGRIPQPPFIPISPAFYPCVVLGVLALLAAGLVIQALLGGPPAPARATPAPTPRPRGRGSLVTLCFALFGLYTATLPWLGYRLSTGLFVAAMQWSLGSRTLRSVAGALGAGAATALVTYVVFQLYLQVLLPRGVLVP